MTRFVCRLGILAFGLLLLARSTVVPAAANSSTIKERDYAAVFSHPNDEAQLETFLGKLQTVHVARGGAMRTLYVWEGDLLLDRDSVITLIKSHNKPPGVNEKVGELLVMTDKNQRRVYWKRTQRHLTYGVDKNSFPKNRPTSAYSEVVSNMQKAAHTWEQACTTCNVKITYDGRYDESPDGHGLTFVVRYDPNITEFIAASFFPNDPVENRVLIVAPDYLTTTVDHAGVFRHEIGHILGYRHEHIQGIDGCNVEDANWSRLTHYDPVSVMHYLCGKGGTMEMALSKDDIAGHRDLYGTH